MTDSTTRPIGIAVAGLGPQGRMLARAIATEVPGAALAAVIDLDADLLREVGEELAAPESSSLADVLTWDHTDAVVIATPTSTHGPLVREAIAAGKPIFLEKPVSLDWREGVEILDLAIAEGVLVQVGLHCRFDHDFRAVKDLAAGGRLGSPYYFRAVLRDMETPDDLSFLASTGSLLVDATLHDIDLAAWLIDAPVVEVTAIATSVSDPAFAEAGDMDWVTVTLRFAGGALAVLETARVAGYGFEHAIELIGSKGGARIGGGTIDGVEHLTPGLRGRELVSSHLQRHAGAYRAELREFAARVRNGERGVVYGAEAMTAFSLAKVAEQAIDAASTLRVVPETTGPWTRYVVAAD